MLTPKIGEISHGTLRSQDLIETFADEYKRLCGASQLFNADLHQRAKGASEVRTARTFWRKKRITFQYGK